MNKYKVWIWFTIGCKKELSYKVVTANSPEDAKRKADVWEKIIHKVELVKHTRSRIYFICNRLKTAYFNKQ